MIAVKRELRVGIGLLLVCQMVMALGAIGLLSRLVPAIDRILQENVSSIESAERMLVALALHEGGDELDRDFGEALSRAKANVTEPAEEGLLARIERGAAELAAGDPSAYRPTVEAIQELVSVNREAMRRTRAQASRLSEAGAWAVVLLAMIVFSAGIVVAVRVQRRIIEPLDEMFAVARAAATGDPYRRCQIRDAPAELRQLMATFNEVLDERFSIEQEEQDEEDDSSVPAESR